MNVSAIFPGTNADQVNILQNGNQQRRTEFQKLTHALPSEDLASAPRAIGALLKSVTSSVLQSLRSPQSLNVPRTARKSRELAGALEAYPPTQRGLQPWHSIAAHHHRPQHAGSSAAILSAGFPRDAGNSAANAGTPSAAFQPVNLMA